MYTQIQQFPSFIFSKIMSTSQEDSQQKDNSILAQDIITTSVDQNKQVLLLEEQEIIKNKETDQEATGTSRNEESNSVSDNDDGFKTPTSPSHKIPTTVQCPPAPRKLLAQRLKRKASPPLACRRLQFNEPADVESIFRAMSDQDNVEETKTKKARRTEKD